MNSHETFFAAVEPVLPELSPAAQAYIAAYRAKYAQWDGISILDSLYTEWNALSPEEQALIIAINKAAQELRV